MDKLLPTSAPKAQFQTHRRDIDAAIRRVLAQIPNWRRRLSDEEVFHHASPSDMISTAGLAGQGFVADDCRCLHFGERARHGERLVLMISYGHVFFPMDAAVGITPNPSWYPDDPLRKLALGLS